MHQFKRRFAFKGIASLRIIRSGRPDEEENETKTTEEETYPKSKLEQFCENFDVEVLVKRGEVYFAKFPNKIGSEIRGDHFVVAATNSNVDNPNVLAFPLTSLKDKHKNPAHSLYLGYINGIDNGKESIALLNQVQCIDKRRLLNDESIKMAMSQLEQKDYEPNEIVCEIGIQYYRLTNLQLNKLISTYRLYFNRNSQSSRKKKLVDF